LNNFAPVFALLVALVFWRQQIPYLRHRHTQRVMLVIFLIGSVGSSLLFVDAAQDSSASTIEGNLWAIGAVLTDVALVIAQIRYIRQVTPLQVPLVNFYVFLLALPIFLLLFGLNPAHFAALPAPQLGWGIFIGVFGAFGYYLNYEAFRRIDGFIAFLMFNLSILITFCVEAFILKAIPPSFILIVGGCLILGASVWAESINTRCEREMAGH
jgi:drug/metabolite transporter (DMT)-like permease